MKNPTETQANLCRICDLKEYHPVYRVREMMCGLDEEFLYFQCVQCKCLQIIEFPANISKYYPKGYLSFVTDPSYFYRKPLESSVRRLRDSYSALGKGLIGQCVEKIYPAPADLKTLSLIPLTKESKILDVGCGTGTLLYLLYEAGFSNLLGVDPYIDQDIKYENGLTILRQGLQEVKGSWDLIMFHHSFEHMQDPTKTLQSVSRLLKPGGFCLIRVPVVSSFAWENYGVHWVQIDAPRHFFLHSLDSLRILVRKEKFYIEDIVFDSDEFQFWGSEQYENGISLQSEKSYSVNPAKSIFNQKQVDKFRKKAEQLNRDARGDQAVFYLKKIDAF
ncbi:MAG: class I SAM-dependent methyltransferase [Nitrospina sp.]|jgi:SAM-dependent methyltransferase|nr:class I SAM-dependent methyltransferase [Nitrospina sp.]MBT6600447.1 class I SAM-dependent methyltransferase [Nitrospina sp.]